MKPWVSIVTPICNGIEFLEQCAVSVCLQNLSEWEWWIGINGHGSGGDVLKKAKEIARKCEDTGGRYVIHVVNLPEARGKVAALNQLVERCIGEWVAVLDVDDTWERNKLVRQKAIIDQSKRKIDVIGTFCRYFGEVESNGPRLPAGFIPTMEFWRSNPIINSSALIRRELAVWSDRFYGLDDYDLWMRLAIDSAVFYNVGEFLVNHRIHSASAFNGKGQDVEGLLAYHRSKVMNTIT